MRAMRLLGLCAVLLVGLTAFGSAPGTHAARLSADRFVDLNWLDSQRGWALVSTACRGTGTRCSGVYGTRTGGRTWIRLTAVNEFGCARASECVTRLPFITPRI